MRFGLFLPNATLNVPQFCHRNIFFCLLNNEANFFGGKFSKLTFWAFFDQNFAILDQICSFRLISPKCYYNMKTLNYIKKCKKMKSSRYIQLTKKYLKENDLLAIPFDKGVGICVMKRSVYQEKLDAILDLPQFEKHVKARKNAMHPLLKEEERVVNELKRLKREGRIDGTLYHKLKPRGSQPARLYGLAKVHKSTTPVRPVLSMPGSCYFKTAEKVAEWLSVVDECKINSSTQQISEMLNTVTLDADEQLVSFDVTSLYTNVPVTEAIDVCTDLLYSGKYPVPPVDKETFRTLAQISSCNVLMLTHNGYVRQKDGLAMGSPPAPHLANGWLSQFDGQIKGDAKLFSRYMDDIIRNIRLDMIEATLAAINSLHPALKFTMEVEEDGELPFLDMKLINSNGQLSSTWYSKPTDTGLIMNYHSMAPKRYKRSVVSGFVYRIFRACSCWANFHISLERAKKMLERNQYPPAFYNPIIDETISNIVNKSTKPNVGVTDDRPEEESVPKALVFVQYRGKVTEDFARALHRAEAPCNVVFTMRKLRTILPSLKPAVDKELRGSVVYQLKCSRCNACYVGQTDRHFCTRLKEHQQRKSQPVYRHFQQCRTELKLENTEFLAATIRNVVFLETLEALWIEELKPSINTREEYKQRSLTIRLSSGF